MPSPLPLAPRPFGVINWIGLLTLTRKEIDRFLKVYTQTILSPIVSTLLFYLVFAVALGGAERAIHGVPYLTFLAPGLIMMGMAQNAFANTSSSLVISKVQGNIVDVLMVPLTSGELLTGYTVAGVVRGLVVGLASWVGVLPFVWLEVVSWPALFFFGISGMLLLSFLGILTGLWSDKFDQMAAITNFVIAPLTMLSGTFYSAEDLPPAAQLFCHLNPFFYMIDGFRYAFIGGSDSHLMVGGVVLTAANLILGLLCYVLLVRGWKIKS